MLATGGDSDSVSAAGAAEYLERYSLRYGEEYERFCAPPPTGGNYPRLPVSPYLSAESLTCYLATDGAAVVDLSSEPLYDWAVAGGPALLVDEEPTRTPDWVRQAIRKAGLEGQHIGIYRIVSQTAVRADIWAGKLPAPTTTAHVEVGSTAISVESLPVSWTDLIESLSFGAFGPILDLRLPPVAAPYWTPRIIRDLGIATADRVNKRFFHYLELLRHVNQAAWDVCSIPARVAVDIRRDFAWAAAALGQPGGTLSFGDQLTTPIEILRRDRLGPLTAAITEMQVLLDGEEQDERVFHEYLQRHPVLLDVYARAVSKPRWNFPATQSPLGKAYVEPDFVLRYPGDRYKLVELEKPGHILATIAGHPSAAVTHAAFQIAEWRDYIAYHYELLKDDYPGIAADCPGLVVISRQTQSGFSSPSELARYLTLVRRQLAMDVLTYDDLLERARVALAQLSVLD